MDFVSRDWFLRKPGHADAFSVARALRTLLQTQAIPRKRPIMSDTACPDPTAQIELWLKEYLAHMKCQDLAAKLSMGVVFRIVRTMYDQGKTLDDVHGIIRDMAKGKTKPKSMGYLITVIEGNLGKVA